MPPSVMAGRGHQPLSHKCRGTCDEVLQSAPLADARCCLTAARNGIGLDKEHGAVVKVGLRRPILSLANAEAEAD